MLSKKCVCCKNILRGTSPLPSDATCMYTWSVFFNLETLVFTLQCALEYSHDPNLDSTPLNGAALPFTQRKRSRLNGLNKV